MNVTVFIDEFEVIPIRAIPFITGGKITADTVASIFAHTDPWEMRRRGLTPCLLESTGEYSQMLPKEWDDIESDLKVLRAKLKAVQEVEQEKYAEWRRESLRLLPPGCFVRKDDFETTFLGAYSPVFWEILDERPGDRQLNFSPYVPRELEQVVMEGFPKSQAEKRQWPWGDYETPLLRLIWAAVNKWCFLKEYPQKKTGEVQEWIKAEMEKAGLPVSDSLVATLKRLFHLALIRIHARG